MKTIVIIGAMPSELADIRNILGEAEIKKFSGFNFYINTCFTICRQRNSNIPFSMRYADKFLVR